MTSSIRLHGGAKSAVIILLSTLVFTANSKAVDSTDTAQRPPTHLQGGVVKVQTSIDDLRDARLSISRVRKSVANLYDEVTREQMSMTYNPNLIGTTVITVPMPVRTGITLPARPKWVRASMNEMRPTLTLFKEDVDIAIESDRHVDASERTKEALAPLRSEAFGAVEKSFKIFQQLESLTQGPSFDNESIATNAKSLDKELKELDRSLKKGISILQKEAKASKKSNQTGA